ncbi:hypothetical protein [Prochlorococcus marinus]|nr:hypothetical protein [Prochlorococcus marinus]
MNKKTIPDNDAVAHSEEYWKEENLGTEDEPYFPLEESKPPHY